MGPYLQQAIATEDIAGWPVAGNPQAWTHLAHFRQLQDAQQFLLSPSKGEAFYFWPGTLVGHFLRPNSCGWSFDGFLQRWLVASLSGSSGYRSVLDEKRFLFPTEPKEWADVPWESCSSAVSGTAAGLWRAASWLPKAWAFPVCAVAASPVRVLSPAAPLTCAQLPCPVIRWVGVCRGRLWLTALKCTVQVGKCRGGGERKRLLVVFFFSRESL